MQKEAPQTNKMTAEDARRIQSRLIEKSPIKDLKQELWQQLTRMKKRANIKSRRNISLDCNYNNICKLTYSTMTDLVLLLCNMMRKDLLHLES